MGQLSISSNEVNVSNYRKLHDLEKTNNVKKTYLKSPTWKIRNISIEKTNIIVYNKTIDKN